MTFQTPTAPFISAPNANPVLQFIFESEKKHLAARTANQKCMSNYSDIFYGDMFYADMFYADMFYGDMFSNKRSDGGGCFSASTKIHTPNGDVEISKFKVGDAVYSLDDNGNRVIRAVEKVIVHEGCRPLHIFYGETDEPLRITANHPILMQSNGWRAAGELKAGDQIPIVTQNGKQELVTISHIDRAENKERVYNLHVDGKECNFLAGSERGGYVTANNFIHLVAAQMLAQRTRETVKAGVEAFRAPIKNILARVIAFPSVG